jgi:hypothetical protein
MADSRSYTGITQKAFDCIKATGERHDPPAHYNPPNGPKGTVTIKIFIIGEIDLTFAYDSSKEIPEYTIVKKPGVVSVDQIWDGFDETVKSCKG